MLRKDREEAPINLGLDWKAKVGVCKNSNIPAKMNIFWNINELVKLFFIQVLVMGINFDSSISVGSWEDLLQGGMSLEKRNLL